MPRHHRQRPAWLPRWVPFKDGRILGLAKQTILAWSSTCLALAFFLMTVAYATEESRFSASRLIHSSRSNTILVLRVLSEAAGVFLGASICSTFEVVQWVLISRHDGLRMSQFLALQPSTGRLGLLVLALGKGLPTNDWPMKPRILSLLRLIGELAVPVLGVLIMSNVNINVEYVPMQATLAPFAVGMEPFNGSVASQLGVMEDLLFNMGYVSFLVNPLHAIDLAHDSENGCSKGLSVGNSTSCSRRVLITQEFQNFEANLPQLQAQYQISDVMISLNQQAYLLEYRDNVDMPTDARCEMFHSGPSYYRFCASNGEDGWVHAAMRPCPFALVTNGTCLSNSNWETAAGFTSALKASFVNATISYGRQDGSILSQNIQSDPAPSNIDALELLEAMTHILNTTETPFVDDPATFSILGPPSNMFGRLVVGHMYRISKMITTNPATRLKGTNALQSLIAITLFYCQNGVLAQTVLPFSPSGNGTAIASPTTSTGAFGQQDPNAYIALAETRYKIRIGRATLVAYVTLGGLALIICIIALIIGSFLELVELDAEPTLWPALDFWTQCRVETEEGVLVPAEKRSDLAWIKDGKESLRQIETLRVKRRKRKLRDLPGTDLPVARSEQEGEGTPR